MKIESSWTTHDGDKRSIVAADGFDHAGDLAITARHVNFDVNQCVFVWINREDAKKLRKHLKKALEA